MRFARWSDIDARHCEPPLCWGTKAMGKKSRAMAPRGSALVAAAAIWTFAAAVPVLAQQLPLPPAGAEVPPPPPETPASNAMTTPSMAGPLVANPNPWNFNAPLFGKVYVTGVASGLGLAQQNATFGDKGLHADVSNAHAIAQTTEGLIQFYVQGGMYSFPTLGPPYCRACRQ